MADTESELSEITEQWDAASVLADQQVAQMAQNEALLNNRHLTPRKIGRSAIFVPKLSGYHQRKMADFVGQFIGDSPVSAKETLTSTKLGAAIYQKVHNYYLDRLPVPYETTIYDASYCGLAYNFAAAFIDVKPEHVTTQITETAPDESGELQTQTIEESRVVDITPIIEVLPPEDVRIDPSVSWNNIDAGRYVGYRRFIDRAEATENTEKGLWPAIDENEFTTPSFSSSAGNALANERRSVASPFAGATQFDIDNGLIEVRYHFYFKQDGKEFTPVRAVTLGDVKVLEEPKPLEIDWGAGLKHAWPFVVGQVYPKPFELYAAAMPERGKDLQLEVNAIRNQRRDNVALILNPEKYVTEHAGVSPQQLAMSYPGKVVTVSNLGAIQWQTVPDVTATGHNEESRVEADMDRLFSEGPLRSGVEGRRKESATAVQELSSNASAQSGLNTVVFNATFVQPLNEKLAAGIRQMAPDEIFTAAASDLMIHGNIDPTEEATRGQIKLNVFAGSDQNEFATQLSNVSNVLGMIQTLYGPQANYKPLVDKVVGLLGLDPDSIIPDPFQMNQPNVAALDQGGVNPQGAPSVQPRAQFQGGAMPEGSGKQ